MQSFRVCSVQRKCLFRTSKCQVESLSEALTNTQFLQALFSALKISLSTESDYENQAVLVKTIQFYSNEIDSFKSECFSVFSNVKNLVQKLELELSVKNCHKHLKYMMATIDEIMLLDTFASIVLSLIFNS